MSEASIVAKDILRREQIEENTIADSNTNDDLERHEKSQNTKFFGVLVTDKEKNFFNLTEALWNVKGTNSKGTSTKRRMAEMYAYFWIFNLLSTPTTINKQSVEKNVANSSNTTEWLTKNKVKQEFDNCHASNRCIIEWGKVEIWDDVTILADVVTYSQPQLLGVGEVITINGAEYTVISENVEGKEYQLSASPGDGNKKAMYAYDFTDKQNTWPRLKFTTLHSSINY